MEKLSPKQPQKPRYSTVVFEKNGRKNVYFTEKSLLNQKRRISGILDLSFIGLAHELRHSLAYELLSKCGLILPNQASIESESIVIGLECETDDVEIFRMAMTDAPIYESLSNSLKEYLTMVIDNIRLANSIFNQINTLNNGIVEKYKAEILANHTKGLNAKNYIYEAEIDSLVTNVELQTSIKTLQLNLMRSKMKYSLLTAKEQNQVKILLGGDNND